MGDARMFRSFAEVTRVLGLLKKLFAGTTDKRTYERAAVLVQEGYVLARTGKLTPALAKYDEACAMAPTFGLAHLNRALCRQDVFNLKGRAWSSTEKTATLVRIAEDLERAVELMPDEIAAWRCLGHVSRRLCRYTRADFAFSMVEERAPADYEHRAEAIRERHAMKPKVGKERALDAVQALLVDKDAPEADVMAALAAVRPLVDEARAAYKGFTPIETAAASPKETAASPIVDEGVLLPVDVIYAIGVLERRAGDVVRAAEALAFVVDVDKEHPGAHRELSTIAAIAGNAGAALRHALAAYRSDPANAALVCNVGVAHLSLGQLVEAEEYLSLAKSMAPKDPIVERAWSALSDAKRVVAPA
jgi:tetratricopeptide (TPR) repeat protein